MPHRIRTRLAKTPLCAPKLLEAADDVERYLSDSSRTPGGSTPRVALPTSEGEVAWVLAESARVLTIGAQSSLTGGATPQGEVLLSTERLTRLGPLEGDRIRVEAGVPLISLQEALAEKGAFYPPAPTYNGALVGGTVGTNAAGAATWKYGSTRDWVEALTVVLASGEVLDIRRGEFQGSAEGTFEVESTDGAVTVVPVPSYTMPDVAKRSAGYHAEPGMDLVDLFIGSEGTLGVVTEVEFRVLTPEPPILLCFLSLPSEELGFELVGRLRDASRATWSAKDEKGLDVRAIECVDGRCLELLREEGHERASALPADAALGLFVQLELPAGLDAEAALGSYGEEDAPDSPIGRLFDLFAEFGVMDDAEIALPDDRAGREALLDVREAVPVAVNHRVQAAQQRDPRIHKVGGDMIVPFERFAEAQAVYRRELGGRGLDYCVWGHISDGNVHPNVIPRSYEDVEHGHEALLACGREVARLGGCPLSEHGTGRNPIKQALLRQLYGEDGLDAMRATKRALDPEWKLAPGVVFPE